MNISDVVSATTPVTVIRGPVTVVLDCYLEKISPENEEYDALLTDDRAARVADEAALAAQNVLLDANYLQSQLFPGEKPLTPKQIEDRTKKIGDTVRRLADERKATEMVLLRNKAARIVYLAKSWDFTHTVDGSEQPLPLTAETVLQRSPQLITQILQTIEESVFGPFA